MLYKCDGVKCSLSQKFPEIMNLKFKTQSLYYIYGISLCFSQHSPKRVQSFFPQSDKRPSCVVTGNLTSFDRKFHWHAQARTHQQVRKFCQLGLPISFNKAWQTNTRSITNEQSGWSFVFPSEMQQLLTGYEEVGGQLRAGFKLGSVWAVLGVYKDGSGMSL